MINSHKKYLPFHQESPAKMTIPLAFACLSYRKVLLYLSIRNSLERKVIMRMPTFPVLLHKSALLILIYLKCLMLRSEVKKDVFRYQRYL